MKILSGRMGEWENGRKNRFFFAHSPTLPLIMPSEKLPCAIKLFAK
jgi:hypothetical protein